MPEIASKSRDSSVLTTCHCCTTFSAPEASHHLGVRVVIPHQRLTSPTKSFFSWRRTNHCTRTAVIHPSSLFPRATPRIDSWNLPKSYERLFFSQPLSAPERIFSLGILMYRIFFHSITLSCPLRGRQLRHYTPDEIMMQ